MVVRSGAMAVKSFYSVPSIVRAFAVLETVALAKRELSVAEISRKLGLPNSSTDLIVKTLERGGYLQRSAHNGRYFFGLKLVNLGGVALDSLDLRQEAKSFLQALMHESGLTVHMAVPENNGMIIIEKLHDSGMLKLASFVGRRIDAHCTGVGKALIAFMPPEAFDQQISTRALARHNENTIVSMDSLKREVLRIRAQGYALDDEEDELGVRCIGAPVFGHDGRVIAAISVAGAVSQIPIERVRVTGEKVRLAAKSISLHMGYSQ